MRTRSKTAIGISAVAAGAATAATAAAAAVALRRWERSELAREELAQLPDSQEQRVRTPDGAELVAFKAGARTAKRAEGAEGAAEADGPPALFVLVHGWTNDSRVWAPVAKRLVEAGHEVVMYDQRGHGASGGGTGALTFDALASDLMAVLDHFDARDAIVVGHSMGGMTAQSLAVDQPKRFQDRVGAMVLVGTSCGEISRNRLTDVVAGRVISHPRLDRAMQLRTLGPFLVRRVLGKNACRAHLDAMCEMFVGTAPEVRSGFLATMNAMDLAAALPDLQIPVTVVVGERDNLLPRKHSRQIASLISGSDLMEIPDVGHMVQIEAPDLLVRILTDVAGRRVHDPAESGSRTAGRGTSTAASQTDSGSTPRSKRSA